MNALVLKEYMKFELEQMPVPEIGPNDVLVRVKACGICGSDVHGMDGRTGRRIPPIVMGHEASGEVALVGSAVKDFKEGDRVTFDSTVYCGKCFYCVRGDLNLCENRQVLGVSPGEYRRHGAFAEFVSVPSHIMYKLPDTFKFEHAALIEAVSIAVHAVRITPIELGDVGICYGAGMIGLLTVQAMRNAGCTTVIAIDMDDAKLALSKELGATHTFNRNNGDPLPMIQELTGGRGADVGIECVGITDCVQTLIKCVRKGGSVTLVGNLSPSIDFPLQSVVTRQIRVQGSCASNGEYPVCIDLIARGIIKVQPLISAIAPLVDGPAWFDRLYRHEPNLMKVILVP